jgi:hypothetical protein
MAGADSTWSIIVATGMARDDEALRLNTLWVMNSEWIARQ